MALEELEEVNPVQAPLFYSSFVVVATLLLLNIFLVRAGGRSCVPSCVNR
jgi:hypothetical protein